LNTIDADEKGTDICEALFTAESIAKCIESLKNNKAPGIESVHNKSMKYGGPQLVHSLTVCLNSWWLSENTPSMWAKASVHLIYKRNDSDIFAPESYRPISLTSNVSKVFERALFNRMQPETDNVLPEEQAGFCKGRSCMDQVYILIEILDSRRRLRLPTYACFIDLKQAFPSTWRDAIWCRLREAVKSGRMYRIIRSLYMNNESSIITPYGLTESFESNLGTRQGAVLSPFLFSLVISPIVDEVRIKDLGVHLKTLLIPRLLYADDFVLIAETPQQLETMLNHATNFNLPELAFYSK
jgi:hypothetical protein